MADLVEIWRQIILGDQKSWVLFENGTCVILMEPELDLRAQTIEIMQEWGPVHAGSAAGDFGTIKLDNAPGWVVTGHHPEMLTYVAPDELDNREPTELAVGLLGRSKRNRGSEELRIVHLEDRCEAA